MTYFNYMEKWAKRRRGAQATIVDFESIPDFNWIKLFVVLVLVNDAVTDFIAANWLLAAAHFVLAVIVMLAWKRVKVIFVDR